MEVKDKAIGFIGGGAMAEAIIKGLCNLEGKQAAANLLVAEPMAERRAYLEQNLGVRTTSSNDQVTSQCEGLVLAVKPQVMERVCRQIAPSLKPGQWAVSIAAGISVSKLEKWLGAIPVVRVMPNTPALIGKGVSALSPGTYCDDRLLKTVQSLLAAAGETVVVPESYMDGVTGLSGSGPAYVYLFIEALIDAGVRVGLPRDVSRTLALATVSGSAEMLSASGLHPAQEKDRVTSPGGTTIAGLQVLEEKGFRAAVMAAVEAACRRSKELGQG